MRLHKRKALSGALLAVAAAFFLALTATASTPPGTQFLPGDNFEIDGNKPVDNAGKIDWASPPPNLVTDPDAFKGDGQVDNSFGQGSKEDTAVPTIVSGSIPPNKSDFSEFQSAHQKAANGDVLLYLDWTRTNILGSADMDFELNQSSESAGNGTSFSTGTPKRTQGDVLVTFDFAKGANAISIHTATWNGDATSGSWSPLVTLTASQAVASISDDLTFGELAIDLNAAGIFAPNKCESFSQAYLKSRSSDSFTAELKDFVAPKPVNITNCGSVLVSKVDFDSGAPLAGAKFSVAPGSTDANGNTAPSTALTEYPGGLYCADNLLFGSHTVTEDQAPPNYEKANPASQTFTVGDNGTCASRIAGGSPPDLTFQDQKRRGAIRVLKTAKDKSAPGGSAPLAGAAFTVNGVTKSTDSNGVACFDNLPFGSYTVHESSAPAGYSGAADTTASVTARGDCSAGYVTVPVVDVPLSAIDITFHSLAGPGKTVATSVQCQSVEKGPLADGQSATYSNLAPGTYNCTVVIDP